MSKRYKPHGDVNYVVTRDFHIWGPRLTSHDIFIEVRDLVDDRGRVYQDGYHKVVITGPQPRPRSKAFEGESAWCDARRYATDAYSQLQRGTN